MRKIFLCLFIILASLCIFSCKQFNQSIETYCKYWTGTVKSGKWEVESRHGLTQDNGNQIDYIECNSSGNVRIYLYVINPQEYELFDGNTVLEGDSQILDYIQFYEQGTHNSLESSIQKVEVVQPDTICFDIQLNDEDEGKILTIDGHLRPREMEQLWEEDDFVYSFKQRSTPDDLRDLSNAEPYFVSNDIQKRYVTFIQPNLSLKRNQGLKYCISYWDGETKLGEKELDPIADNISDEKNKYFKYYFEGQEEDIYYDYQIIIKSPNGLETRLFSTKGKRLPNLNCEITVSGDGVTHKNSTYSGYGDYDTYDIELNYEGSNKPIISGTTDLEGAELRIYTNNRTDNIMNKGLDIGPNNLVIKIVKNNITCKYIEKKIYVRGILKDPGLELIIDDKFKDGFDDDGNPIYKYSFIDYYRLPYKITKKDPYAKMEVGVNYNIGSNICSEIQFNGVDVAEADGLLGTTIDDEGNVVNKSLDTLNGLPEGIVTIRVIVTRDNCDQIDKEFTVNVSIYQLKLKIGNKVTGSKVELACWFDTKNARGRLYLKNNTAKTEHREITLFDWEDKDDKFNVQGKTNLTEIPDGTNKYNSGYIIFDSYNEKIEWTTYDFRGDATWGDHRVQRGGTTTIWQGDDKTIAELKTNNWVFWPERKKRDDGNGHVYWFEFRFTFVVFDDLHPEE